MIKCWAINAAKMLWICVSYRQRRRCLTASGDSEAPEHLDEGHLGFHQGKTPEELWWQRFAASDLPIQFSPKGHVGDSGDLWQQPSNAVSGSVPKGHVGHLNDLVPIGRGKPVRVKSIYKKGDCHIDCQWLWRSNCHLDYYDCRLDCQSIVNDYEEGAGTSKGLSKRQGHGANSRLQQELRCPGKSFCLLAKVFIYW